MRRIGSRYAGGKRRTWTRELGLIVNSEEVSFRSRRLIGVPLLSFTWCRGARNSYFSKYSGGVLAGVLIVYLSNLLHIALRL
jgi:hypothetical protein